MEPTLLKRLLHPVILIGLVLAVVGFGASSFALVADFFSIEIRPYQGILTFLLFPSVMFAGFFIIVAGLFLERRRSRRLAREEREWTPPLDMAKKRHRAILLSMVLFTGLFVLASLVGAYRAYEFTESTEFCGELCHAPMGPQYTAFQDSPHASVHCSTCHVGPGIEHYLEAKISGLRQVYQVLTSSYERPIHAPGERILPARETCEHCHWPEKFWGERLDNRTRFGYDLQNTRRLLRMVLHVGGGKERDGARRGIHWHMNLENRVSFRAADPLEQEIPWVRVKRPDGTSDVYVDRENRLDDEAVARLPEKRMDCLDCHNRPAHRFLTPDVAVDRALEDGELDSTLPFIKKVAVETLAKRYDSSPEAKVAIRERITGYYRDHFDGVVLSRREAIERAVATVQSIYQRNVFPEMRVDWGTYPDNIGHRSFPGCFRCHGGRHVAGDGTVLGSDCATCHTFFEEARDSSTLVEIPAGGTTLHPFHHAEHYELSCWSCHEGASSPYSSCASCHEEEETSHGMQFECSICHEPGRPRAENEKCASCHPTGASALHASKDHGDCLGCHQPHTWKVDYRASCSPCHETLGKDTWETHYPGKSCSPCHDFTGVLRQMKGLPVKR